MAAPTWRKDIARLAQLNGKKVGVLTGTGQTSVAARITVEKAGASATDLPLVKVDRIHAALAAGQIAISSMRWVPSRASVPRSSISMSRL